MGKIENDNYMFKRTKQLKTPVLFLVFNRPDTTKRVFETIKNARPPKLYVAADGPRLEKEGEDQKAQDVREIATAVDWDCEVKTLFRDQNIGCKEAVGSAISWFFEHEEEGIILEDDCVPDKSFFPFCQELLDKYRNDSRVMAISGDNFQEEQRQNRYSYYFSRIPHCWGWATWRRAWQFYDINMEVWPEIQKNKLLNDIACGDELFVKYWSNIFTKCYEGKIDSWAYIWTLYCWVQSGLTILPNINLVSNIGFGERATHTKAKNCKYADLYAESIKLPLVYPPHMIRDYIADRYTDRNIFGIKEEPKKLWCRIARRIQAHVCGN